MENNIAKTERLVQLNPISLKPKYAKEWNVGHLNDFVVLTDSDGNMLSNTLYRVGGVGSKPDGKKQYFMLLKYVEAYWHKELIEKTKGNPKHLSGSWCIIDKYGNEKVNCKQFDYISLIKDSCLYRMDRKYYNIETGYCYGVASSEMESSEFIFLDTSYERDKDKCGIIKINKQTGEWCLFK